MSNYAHPETLVQTDWLLERLEDPQIVIIEMDLDSQPYDRQHIPGSIFWSAYAPLLPNMGINFDPQAIAQLFGNSGITNETTVVLTHRSFIATSGFIFWLCKIFGHRDVKILNGGLTKWQQENLPLTDKVNLVTPTKYAPQTPDRNLRVTQEVVQQAIAKEDTIILDVRTPQEYRGEIYLQKPPQTNDERAGHIPQAIHLYYELAHNDDDTFKSASELQQLYQNAGVTKERLIIPYCAVGARSAHTWFILKYLLGYKLVKNYDGSWNEWSRVINNPIAQ